MDAVSRNIQSKFDVARLLLDRMAAGQEGQATAQRLQSELAAQEVRYALATGHLFLKAAGSETGRLAVRDEFARVLAAENFGGDIDAIVDAAEAAIRTALMGSADKGAPPKLAVRKSAAAPTSTGTRETLRSKAGRAGRQAESRPAVVPAIPADIQRALDAYPHANRAGGVRNAAEDAKKSGIPPKPAAPPAGAAVARINYEQCADCNTEMVIDADRSELRCLACSAIRELDGTVFDDAQFYSQEGQKAKSGTFNPNRHFQFWWTHILAREPEEELGDPNDPDNLCGEKLLESLRTIVRRDQKILRFLTVTDMRAMLRELNHTNLNKDVPLLLKKLTGVGPPTPPDSLGMKVEKLFSKAIEIGERLRRPDRTNRNYYPFYVLKTLDCILPEKDECRRILYYIYLQSDDTVRKDDDEWEAICREMDPEIDGIRYFPTDRTKYIQYRPD